MKMAHSLKSLPVFAKRRCEVCARYPQIHTPVTRQRTAYTVHNDTSQTQRTFLAGRQQASGLAWLQAIAIGHIKGRRQALTMLDRRQILQLQCYCSAHRRALNRPVDLVVNEW